MNKKLQKKLSCKRNKKNRQNARQRARVQAWNKKQNKQESEMVWIKVAHEIFTGRIKKTQIYHRCSDDWAAWGEWRACRGCVWLQRRWWQRVGVEEGADSEQVETSRFVALWRETKRGEEERNSRVCEEGASETARDYTWEETTSV